MSIEQQLVNVDQVNKLFSKGEGHFCELKSKDIQPKRLTKTMSAFANADGGELYVGIDEVTKGVYKWNGFDRIEDANGHLQALEEKFPHGVSCHYSLLRCVPLPGLVLFCDVEKTADIKADFDNTPYLRRGAQNLPQNSPEKLERLKYSKGIISYEDQIVNADPSTISNSSATIEFLLVSEHPSILKSGSSSPTLVFLPTPSCCQVPSIRTTIRFICLSLR